VATAVEDEVAAVARLLKADRFAKSASDPRRNGVGGLQGFRADGQQRLRRDERRRDPDRREPKEVRSPQ
jgi:hypothetical protein